MFIYIIFFIGVVMYAIKKDIDLYKKGKYNPYVFRLKKDEEDIYFWKRFGIMLFVIVGPDFFFPDDQKYIVSWMFFATIPILIAHTSTLNYLTYKKNKDKKIIIQTLIYTVILLILMMLFWEWILF